MNIFKLTKSKLLLGTMFSLALMPVLSSTAQAKDVKCDKITPITMFFHFRDRMAYNEDLPIVRYVEKQTCTKIVSLAPKYASKSLSVLNLHLASGHLADVIGIHNFKPIANKYGMQGAFMPLNNLIDKYAPHIKKVFAENPEAKIKASAADGNIYYLPYFTPPKLKVGRAYFIREDWLKKLHLPVPKTVAELEKTLIAFRDQDPNGNGRKDEVPYCGRHWQEAVRLVNLFGSRTSGSDYYFDFYVNKQHKIKYAFVEPKFKEAYKHVIKWYKDKLIDAEIFTRGKRSREILFSRNQCGMVHDWISSTTSFNNAMQKRVPGFKLIAINPPKGIDGSQYEEHSRELVRKDGWGMARSTKHPIEVIKFLDWFYSPEGSRTNNYGIPGVSYNMVNGQPKFTKKVLAMPAVQDYLYKMGAAAPLGYVMDANYELQMVSPEVRNIYTRYTKFLIDQYPGVAYNKAEQRLYDRAWTVVNSNTVPEYLQKWMLGTADIDKTWDEYIQKIKVTGFFKLLDETQEAYNRTYKK